MQSSKSNVTSTTRHKKMAEICSLIKYFIRYANKRKLLLKLPSLLSPLRVKTSPLIVPQEDPV